MLVGHFCAQEPSHLFGFAEFPHVDSCALLYRGLPHELHSLPREVLHVFIPFCIARIDAYLMIYIIHPARPHTCILISTYSAENYDSTWNMYVCIYIYVDSFNFIHLYATKNSVP